jgi:teichoic acid transport system permease protein
MGVNGFKMFIGFGIIILMMIFYHIKPTILVFYAIPILLLLFVITFGVSMFLMHFGVYVDDLANIWNIALRMVMYITGIFFNVETRAKELGPILLKANPMAVVLSSMRKVLLYEQAPDLLVIVLWFVVFLVLSLLGIRIIYKNENNYIKSV